MLHYLAGVVGDVKQKSTIRPGSIVDDVLYPEVHALTTVMLCIYFTHMQAMVILISEHTKCSYKEAVSKYSNGII